MLKRFKSLVGWGVGIGFVLTLILLISAEQNINFMGLFSLFSVITVGTVIVGFLWDVLILVLNWAFDLLMSDPVQTLYKATFKNDSFKTVAAVVIFVACVLMVIFWYLQGPLSRAASLVLHI